MNRIDSYEDLAEQIINWIKDYYWDNDLGGLVVGVSGGIDSAVVSTLCARTGLPTYILTMPLDSKKENTGAGRSASPPNNLFSFRPPCLRRSVF